jgi:hypothetical protein
MLIVFTGHRDRLTNPAALQAIEAQYPGATWMHGGAKGFDAQVHGIGDAIGKAIVPPIVSDALPKLTIPDNALVTVRPAYGRYHPKQAPLIRNKAMVDRMRTGDLLVACYDGRNEGGTAQCVRYAEAKGFSAIRVECVGVGK